MKRPTAPPLKPVRHGVARVMSKLGMGSRTQAARWVVDGRVRVNGTVVRDPEFPVRQGVDRISLDGQEQQQQPRLVIMLNKPRGLVTTTQDERARDTVYDCLAGSDLPWLAPVGRLDKASEGLLLFTNDPVWAAHITSPDSGPDKTYHVQIDRVPDAALLTALEHGVSVDREHLAVKRAVCLRSGIKNAWLELVLEEGRNRQIRRLLSALDISVLRLIRVAVGSLGLGGLAKGQWRPVTDDELKTFMPRMPAYRKKPPRYTA
jgi:23S rRNA pseudouridine2605 synthase